MPAPLPPDLSRLGDQLTAATERAVRRRRRRAALLGRLGTVAAACALALAVLAPTVLGPSERGGQLLRLASAAPGYLPGACESPRQGTFSQRRPCAVPGNTALAALLQPPYASRGERAGPLRQTR
jgi:hypothetical protein